MPLRGAGAEGALLPFTRRHQGHLRAPLRGHQDRCRLLRYLLREEGKVSRQEVWRDLHMPCNAASNFFCRTPTGFLTTINCYLGGPDRARSPGGVGGGGRSRVVISDVAAVQLNATTRLYVRTSMRACVV